MRHTTFGFAARIVGGNARAARMAGLPVGRMTVIVTALAGAAAGLAGMVEVAAVQGSANANIAAGYGFTGILVAFLARQHPLAVIPVAILLGGIGASGGLLQRRLDLPDAAVLVLQGILFVALLAGEGLPPLRAWKARIEPMTAGSLGLWTVPIAVLGGAIRVSTPFLFVSLGELVTEKSGRINLGLEGTLIMGAMSGFGVAYLTGSPWLGVLAAGVVGMALGALHAGVCSLPRVNDIAVGIALMLFGTGLAFYLGKPLVQPRAPTLPALPLGFWSDIPQVRAALEVNGLFIVGLVLTPLLRCGARQHPLGADRAHGRRLRRGRARAGLFADRRAPLRDLLRRLHGRRRRLVPVALLSRQLERRPVERPGHHRGGAGHLRALEPDRLLRRLAAVRRRRRARARRCRRSASPPAPICSTPRPIS